MGVRGARRWFDDLFSGAAGPASCPFPCSHVIVELNPLLHVSASDLPAAADAASAVISRAVAHLQRIITEVCPPQVSLCVVADGAAPLAKLPTQRARRESYCCSPGAWNRCHITPGTPFMKKAARAVALWAQGAIRDGSLPASVDVRCVLDDVAGEGECKAAAHLRLIASAAAADGAAELSVCLVGTDSDLMLAGIAAAVPCGLVRVACVDPVSGRARSAAEMVRQLCGTALSPPVLGMALDLVACALCGGNDCLPPLGGVTTEAVCSAYAAKAGGRDVGRLVHHAADGDALLVDAGVLADVLGRAVQQRPPRRGSKQGQGGEPGGVQEWLAGLVWALSLLHYGRCPSWKWSYSSDTAPDALQLVAWARARARGQGGRKQQRGPPQPVLIGAPADAAQPLPAAAAGLAMLPERALAEVAGPQAAAAWARCGSRGRAAGLTERAEAAAAALSRLAQHADAQAGCSAPLRAAQCAEALVPRGGAEIGPLFGIGRSWRCAAAATAAAPAPSPGHQGGRGRSCPVGAAVGGALAAAVLAGAYAAALLSDLTG
eukprot:TRINITY_DN10064_c0_g1_i1.p1 TRINITY_DN10064_c0_g1~~TRINITY_DN10064_c0_g1_i1.p1  ORF type:complete len:573 (+),score=118.00 TRINITY_DN10064_c0_g1_i1:77-1720(+)